MDANIRNLACAVMLQAVKDYFHTSSAKKKQAILKDLRSNWMQFLTSGTSLVVAEQIEKNPEEIAARLRQNHETEENPI